MYVQEQFHYSDNISYKKEKNNNKKFVPLILSVKTPLPIYKH